MDVENFPNIFSLKHVAAATVANHDLPVTDLPIELKDYVSKIHHILDRPSQIKINVSLSQTVSLIHYEPYLLPEYIFEFAVGMDCYAEINNERTGIDCSCECAPESFSQLELQFQSSSNVSLEDIPQFLSDVTGEVIPVSQFIINNISIDTDVCSPDGVYCVTHTYTGQLSNMNNIIHSFKYQAMTCLAQYKNMTIHESLTCDEVCLDVFSSCLFKYC